MTVWALRQHQLRRHQQDKKEIPSLTPSRVSTGISSFVMVLSLTMAMVAQNNSKTVGHDDVAAAAFEAMIPVLHNPRCMNCHSKGDFPRQGNDRHRHTMSVHRGPAGDGVAGAKCSSCHQDHNLPGQHMPPGAPDWHLPSPEMPMIWEGLTNRQLCELFKDPKQNGGRDVEQIVEHMNTPLVLWGWNPGEGRTPILMPQNEFLANVRSWASNGAACPSN
jgi:hypothetical protein